MSTLRRHDRKVTTIQVRNPRRCRRDDYSRIKRETQEVRDRAEAHTTRAAREAAAAEELRQLAEESHVPALQTRQQLIEAGLLKG